MRGAQQHVLICAGNNTQPNDAQGDRTPDPHPMQSLTLLCAYSRRPSPSLKSGHLCRDRVESQAGEATAMLSRRLKEVERSATGLARREAQVADREGRLAACQQQLQASQDQLARQVGLKSADFQGHVTKCMPDGKCALRLPDGKCALRLPAAPANSLHHCVAGVG